MLGWKEARCLRGPRKSSMIEPGCFSKTTERRHEWNVIEIVVRKHDDRAMAMQGLRDSGAALACYQRPLAPIQFRQFRGTTWMITRNNGGDVNPIWKGSAVRGVTHAIEKEAPPHVPGQRRFEDIRIHQRQTQRSGFQARRSKLFGEVDEIVGRAIVLKGSDAEKSRLVQKVTPTLRASNGFPLTASG